MKPAFGYGRVSTTSREQSTSRENQADEIRRYCQNQNLNLLRIYEESASAYKAGRDEFSAMLDAAEAQGVRDIVFKDSSRVTRNFHDKYLIDTLRKAGAIRVHYYMNGEVLDQDSDVLKDDIDVVMNKRVSDIQSVKSSRAAKHKALNKRQAVTLPIGYRWNREARRWELDDRHAGTIRKIFDLYDNKGMNSRTIADYLNTNEQECQPARGGKWWPGQVHKILHNRAYAGFYTFKGQWYNGDHPAYITDEQYAARVKRMKRGNYKRKTKREQQALSGLMRCPICDRRWTGYVAKRGKHPFYRHDCSEGHKNRAEPMFWNLIDLEVAKVLYNDEFTEWLKKIFGECLDAKRSGTDRERRKTEARIKELDKECDDLVLLYSKDVSSERVSRLISQKESEIATLKEYWNSLTDDLSAHRHKVIDLIDHLREFSNTFLEARPERKTEFLRLMTDAIYVSDGRAAITWKKPFSFLLDNVRVSEGRILEIRTYYENRLMEALRWYRAA